MLTVTDLDRPRKQSPGWLQNYSDRSATILAQGEAADSQPKPRFLLNQGRVQWYGRLERLPTLFCAEVHPNQANGVCIVKTVPSLRLSLARFITLGIHDIHDPSFLIKTLPTEELVNEQPTRRPAAVPGASPPSESAIVRAHPLSRCLWKGGYGLAISYGRW